MKLKKRKNLQSAESRSALNQLTVQSPHLALFRNGNRSFFHCFFTFVPSLFFVFSRSTLLVELEVDNGKDVLNYAAGDHVGVFPENSNELVMGILKHLPNFPPTNQTIQLEYLTESGPGKNTTIKYQEKTKKNKRHSNFKTCRLCIYDSLFGRIISPRA